MVNYKSRFAARRLFDVAHAGVVDANVVASYRLGKVGRDLGRLGEILLPRLLAMADHHHMRPRLTLDVEPGAGLLGQLVGGIFVLHVILAAYIRTVATYPYLNRFVSGQRIYARKE